MKWIHNVYVSAILLAYYISITSGQVCDVPNLEITDKSETTVTLLLSDEAATIYLTPRPCTDSLGVYFGCHCDEDDQLQLKHDVLSSESSYTVDHLFPGRYYRFVITTSDNTTIACGGTNTVPRSPLNVTIHETGSTNTTIPVDIHRSLECSGATEVYGYEIYTLQSDSITNNGTYIDESNDEVVRYDILDLFPGETYDVCVITVSSNLLKSAELCSTDLKTKINAPIINGISENGSRTIHVTWTHVEEEIDSYKIRCESEEGYDREVDIDKDVSEGECEAVTPGALYNVTLYSIKEGYGQYGDPVQNIKALRPTPVKPVFDVLVLTTTHLRASWTVITGHLDLIRYQLNDGTEEEIHASEGRIDITEDLEPNGFYHILLWGVAGINGAADFETATQADLINFQMYSADIRDLEITYANASTIEISWNNPPDNAADTELNHYKVQLWDSGTCVKTIIMNNTELPHIDEIYRLCGSLDYDNFTGSPITLLLLDVEACTNYTIFVVPVNTVGNGMEYSSWAETESDAPTGSVVISADTITATEISIVWSKPEPQNCPMSSRIIVTYIVCENGDIDIADDTLEDIYRYTLPGLQPFTDHNVTVEVFNELGSIESFEVVITGSSAPGPPQGIRYSMLDHSSVNINWDPVHKCEENGIVIGYRLQVCSSDKLGINQGQCNEFEVPHGTSILLTELNSYYEHTCIVQARNREFEGSPIETLFVTDMYYPETPIINAQADCELRITIIANRLNGPLDAYEIAIWREGSQNKQTWSCNTENCHNYGDPMKEMKITHEDFDGPIDLNQGYVYIIEGVVKNTEFVSEKTVSSVEVGGYCPGSTDVGLAVGLTIGFCLIGAAIIGVVLVLKRKGIGPFGNTKADNENVQINNTMDNEDFGMNSYEQEDRGVTNSIDIEDDIPYRNPGDNYYVDSNHSHEIQKQVGESAIDSTDYHEMNT